MDNYTESERKRHQLITEIQGFQKSGLSIRKIAKITGKQRQTVKKYLDGDPDVLCRSKKRSQLELCTDEIIKGIKAGLTSSAIGKQIQKKGYKCTLSNIRQFITTIAEQHELEISKYKSKIHPNESGKDKKTPVDYVTRKGIFNPFVCRKIEVDALIINILYCPLYFRIFDFVKKLAFTHTIACFGYSLETNVIV